MEGHEKGGRGSCTWELDCEAGIKREGSLYVGHESIVGFWGVPGEENSLCGRTGS